MTGGNYPYFRKLPHSASRYLAAENSVYLRFIPTDWVVSPYPNVKTVSIQALLMSNKEQ